MSQVSLRKREFSKRKTRLTKVLPGFDKADEKDDELERFREELRSDKGSREMTIRERLEFALATSKVGMALDFLNTFISLVACLLYVVETYVFYDRDLLLLFTKLDLGISILYSLDFLLRAFVAQKKMAHVMALSTWIDLLSIVPGFALMDLRSETWYNPNLLKEDFSILTFFNLLRVLRIFRCTRITRLLSFTESEILRQIYAMTLQIVCLIYFASGVVHLVENTRSFWPPTEQYHELTFFDVIYLVVTTITTVGYGDVAPVTTPGRLVIMLMMCTALVLVPRQTNKLIALIGMTSVYARQSYKYNSQCSHVVVTGEVLGRGIADFFRELFHPDHGNPNLKAVVIGDGLPSTEIRTLLSDPRLAYMITYLDGNVMNDRDLKRAAIEHAEAVFLLTNKYSNSPAQDDANSILRALSIQRYIHKSSMKRKRKARKGILCLQLVQSESRKLFASSSKQSLDTDQFQNQLVCIDEIKMNIIAKSCLVPGLITMINNLIASSEEAVVSKTEQPWLHEYVEGIGYEIYRVELSENFAGLSFGQMSQIVFEATSTLVFALELTHIHAGSYVCLNPSTFIIPPASDELAIFVFVIAGDLQEALAVKSKDIYRPPSNGTSSRSPFSSNKLLSRVFSKMGNLTDRRGTLRQSEVQSTSILEVTEEKNEGEGEEEEGGRIGALPHARRQSSSLSGASSGRRRSVRLWNAAKESIKNYEESHEEMMFTDYYMFDESVEFEHAHIESVLTDFPSDFGGHIIVVGNPAQLYHFVLPLRSRKLPAPIPIIIMHTSLPTATEWQPLSVFQEIYFLKGSPLDVNDLARVKASTASKAVVFAKSYNVRSRQHEALVDADTIFAYSILQKENPNLHVLVELVAQTNISYISDVECNDVKTTDSDKYVYFPPFAAGNIYSSSMLDTLLGQAFYNPKLISILQQLVVGQDKEKMREWLSKYKFLQQKDIPSSELYLIPVPTEMVHRTFGELFTFLHQKHVLPIGIRRGVRSHDNDNGISMENTMPYVVTNPGASTILDQTDSIFVLSLTIPPSANASQTCLNAKTAKRKDSVSSTGTKQSPEDRRKSFRAKGVHTSLESINTADGIEETKEGDHASQSTPQFNEALQALQVEVNAELAELTNGIKQLMQRIEEMNQSN